MADTDAWAALLAERLVTASIQGGIVIAIVWMACRTLLRLAPHLQATLWWLASLKLIVALIPVAAVSVPLLPPVARAIDAEPRPEIHGPVSSAGPSLPVQTGEASAMLPPSEAPSPGDGPPRTTPWLVALAGLWLAGVGAGVARLLLSFHRVRGRVRRSEPAESDVTTLVANIASSLGLRRVPHVRVSHEIATPQVVGLWRPIVVLPASVSDWSADEQRMAMAHELVHVQRRDVIAGWIPALAERLFFFHPLAHLAAREYIVAREAACDAAVVRSLDVEPADYGRLLVRLGIIRAEPLFGVTGSSSSASALRRRLDMLQHVTRTTSARGRRWIPLTAAVLTLVPLQLVARTEPVLDAPSAALIGGSAGHFDRWQLPIGRRATEQRESTERAAQAQDPVPAPAAPQAQDLEPVPAAPQTGDFRWSEGVTFAARRAERQAAERARNQAAAARQERERAAAQAAAAQAAAGLAAKRAAAAQYEAARLAADQARAHQDAGRLSVHDVSAREVTASNERLAAERARVEVEALMESLRAKIAAAPDATTFDVLERQLAEFEKRMAAVASAQEGLLRQQQTLVDLQRQLAEQLEQLRTSLDRLADETPR